MNFLSEGIHVAGCMRNDGSAGVPDLWSVYLATDDAEATVARAVEHGGQVMVPAMDVMTLGRMAVIVDVGGAVIGMWQPGEHRGFGIIGEPGTPAWFELHTRDYDASLDFYRDVFRWTTQVESDSPEFRYTTLDVGEEQCAGVMDAADFLPDGVPASWSVYFGVADTDVALSEIVALGGEVLDGRGGDAVRAPRHRRRPHRRGVQARRAAPASGVAPWRPSCSSTVPGPTLGTGISSRRELREPRPRRRDARPFPVDDDTAGLPDYVDAAVGGHRRPRRSGAGRTVAGRVRRALGVRPGAGRPDGAGGGDGAASGRDRRGVVDQHRARRRPRARRVRRPGGDVPARRAARRRGRVGRARPRPVGDACSTSPWPLAAWPDVPTRFLLCRDDRFFPADFQRRVVRERLGIVPDEMGGGHLPALAHPRELADRLLAYAATP